MIIIRYKGEIYRLPLFYGKTNEYHIGIIILVLMYIFFFLINSFLFYCYMVFLHMEGRLIDIYIRVTALSTHFFVPYDNEVSLRRLTRLKWLAAN